MIKISIHHHIPGEERQFMQLIRIATGQNVEIVPTDSKGIDIAFCGPYHGGVGEYRNSRLRRIIRGGISKVGPGRHLLINSIAGGIQPLKNARRNVWYTGENERPPFGTWDAYFSFEIDPMAGKNIYWPGAWGVTNFLFPEVQNTPWNSKILDIDYATKPRGLYKRKKKKFACAFVGKAYPFRLQLLKMISELGNIDIYGEASRRKVSSKYEISRDYKFMICPENDLYPGYVTEKPIEAYISETIPIYSGLDSARMLNPKSIINYANHLSKETFLGEIESHLEINKYNAMFKEPIFRKKPTIEFAVSKMQELLS